MKDFLLFFVECIIGFLRYIVGTIIAGMGLHHGVRRHDGEHRPVAILGIPIFLIGVLVQYKT